jgi:uncharacterized protein (TIGR03435 family)
MVNLAHRIAIHQWRIRNPMRCTRLIGSLLGLLATILSRLLHRQVIDQTRMAAHYDFDLTFTPDTGSASFANGGVIGGGPGAPPTPQSEAPALTTALREQLGLTLESTRAPVEVIAVERVSRPTEN